MVTKFWWPPSPPFRYVSRKYEAVIIIQRLEGLRNLGQFDEVKDSDIVKKETLVVEIKWKGQTTFHLLGGLRRKSLKRNLTVEGGFSGDGAVEWNEEFNCFCNFSGQMDDSFFPWEVQFTVFNGLYQGKRKKVSVVGTASLNLAEFANSSEEELEMKVPLTVSNGTTEDTPSLCLSIRLIESRIGEESTKAGQRSIVPLPSSPCPMEAPSREKYEHSAVKASLQKVKIFKDYVSGRRAKKTSNEDECSDGIRSEEAERNFVSDTDSLDDDIERELDENNEKAISRHSFSYETMTSANWAGGLWYTNTIINPEDEDWIFFSNRKLDHLENSTTPVFQQSLQQRVKRRILPWRKRKLSFRSSKTKEEPLLKKDYREEGGDDIDFDRRQLSSSDESSFGWKSEGSTTSRSSFSEFGDDNFSVGSWEREEVISRDGHMKLQTQVFFASIDQRNERAAGESACTAIVAVIANWLQSSRDEMPIKSEFDSLIREGSLEWRNLCENEEYICQFPDKHFDLETVLQAKIHPLSVVPEKSFIGFFHPEGHKGGDFDFLHGAMSFDSIWDEINRYKSDQPGNADPLIYIISWNDHFFVLKVDQDAYYIIDTLGERLFEGCNQAYILKFDKDTIIQQVPEETKPLGEKNASDKAMAKQPKETSAQETQAVCQNDSGNSEEAAIVCKGKESCKEYLKRFLAAIPIRELQADIKKGLMTSTPLHHRLQIEFHYTQLLQPVSEFSAKEVTTEAPAMPAAEEMIADTLAMPISLACA